MEIPRNLTGDFTDVERALADMLCPDMVRMEHLEGALGSGVKKYVICDTPEKGWKKEGDPDPPDRLRSEPEIPYYGD